MCRDQGSPKVPIIAIVFIFLRRMERNGEVMAGTSQSRAFTRAPFFIRGLLGFLFQEPGSLQSIFGNRVREMEIPLMSDQLQFRPEVRQRSLLLRLCCWHLCVLCVSAVFPFSLFSAPQRRRERRGSAERSDYRGCTSCPG